MTWVFGEFALDSGRYRLTHRGVEIHVEPRVLETLVYLVEHRDRVVPKDELLENVWSAAFVTDSALKRAIQEARRALGDDGDRQEFIATVRGRGYRFVAAIEKAPSSGDLQPDTGVSYRSLRRRITLVALGLALLVALLTVLYLRSGPGRRAPPGSGAPVRLAVLPFENIGPVEDDWFAVGLAEEITTRLAKIDGLAIISRTSSKRYADQPLATVSSELDVEYVLEGAVRLEAGADGSPGRIRITPQLIRVEGDRHIWAEIYERALADVFGVQANIAAQVAAALDLALTREQVDELAQPLTKDLDAYTSYLRGIEVQSRAASVEDHRRAAGLFERATELDGRFAAAYARLAIALQNVHMDYAADVETEADEALERARELAPNAVETLMAEGTLAHFSNRFDQHRAAAAFQAALDRDPAATGAHAGLGKVRRHQGRLEEAIRHLERALELDPQNHDAASYLAMTYEGVRRFAEADAMFERAIALAPDDGRLWGWRANLQLAWQGDIRRAQAVLAESPRGVEVPANFPAYLALCSDRPEEAARLADELTIEQLLTWPLMQWSAFQGYRRTGQQERVERLATGLAAQGGLLDQRYPDEYYPPLVLGMADLFAGRGAAALDRFETAADRLISLSRFQGPKIRELIAYTEMELGREEQAVALLAELLETDYQGPLTPARLRVEPWWEPLRDDPGFRALLTSG